MKYTGLLSEGLFSCSENEMLCSEAAESRQALGMANLHVSLEGCGYHLAFWGFVCVKTQK